MWAPSGIKGCRRRRPVNEIKGHRPVNQTLTLGHVHVEGARKRSEEFTRGHS